MLVEHVEPNLGQGRLTVLFEYPAPEAALARTKPADPRVAERFEVYACGVELANGFGELTDAAEQRRRFAAGDGRKGSGAMASAIRSTRIFSHAVAADAAGERRRARLRPAGDAGERRAADRSGGMDAAGRREHEQDRSKTGGDVAATRRTRRARPCAGGRSRRSRTGRRALRDRGDAGHRRADRSRRSRRSDRAAVHSERGRTGERSRARTPIRSATTRIRRSPASCIAIPTGCCSSWCMSARSIAGSASAARWSGRARRRALSDAAYRDALDYIRAHREIWEVILTGGDPLMLSPRRLAEIMADLAAIDHVKIIRIHTRVPVADSGAHRRRDGRGAAGSRARRPGSPPRQSSARTDATRRAPPARGSSMPAFPWSASRCCCAASTTMPATLEALMRAFVECRIKPYYLHHGDLAPGTAHLRTTHRTGPGTDARACAAASPACASRTMCSIFPAATARRRSARTICRRQIRREVNYPRKRAIVSSTIAATFTSIRQSRDRR